MPFAGPKAGDVVMCTAQELIDQREIKSVRETLTRLLQVKFGQGTRRPRKS